MVEDDYIDLCETSDDEEGRVTATPPRARASTCSITVDKNGAICIDFSDDESPNSTVPAPLSRKQEETSPVRQQQQQQQQKKEEVIEIDDSSDDEPVIVVNAPKPLSYSSSDDSDSDFDSSDDEQDRLRWHKKTDGIKSACAATSKPAARKQVEQPAALAAPATTTTTTTTKPPPSDVARQEKEQTNVAPVPHGQSASVLSAQHSGNNAEQWKRTQQNAVGSPSRKAPFTGRARKPSPGRRSYQYDRHQQPNASGFSLQQRQSSMFAERARPNTVDKTATRPIASSASIRRSSYPPMRSLTNGSSSSDDDDLMNSGPVFNRRAGDAKAPRNIQRTNAATLLKSSPTPKVSSPSKKPANRENIRSSGGMPSPRKQPAANIAKIAFGALKSASKGEKRLSSANSGRTALFPSRNQSSSQRPSTNNGPRRGKQIAFGAASRPVRKSKMKSPPPDVANMVALGRKNKGTSALHASIRRGATAKSFPSVKSPSNPNVSRDKVRSALKKTKSPYSCRKERSPTQDRNDRPIAHPRKRSESQVSESSAVDRTVSPTAVDERGVARSHPPSGETSRPVARQPDSRDEVETPHPSKGTQSEEEKSSSCASVVSPTDDIVSPERVSLTCCSVQVSSNLQANGVQKSDSSPGVSLTENGEVSHSEKNDSTPGTSLSENGELLPAMPSRADSTDSPMVDSQASAEFTPTSDSDHELDNDGLVAENASALHDSLLSDEGLNVWTRRTRKRVDYNEATHDLELTDSQQYLDSSPPKKRQKDGSSKAKGKNATNRASESKTTQSKRKRKSASSPESLPDLEDEQDEVLQESLPNIEHLSKYTYDEDGLPTHEFSVLAADDTIYDLKIQVKQSEIPGAGMGAFLTFEGARLLKEELRTVAAKTREERIFHETDTTKPLEAAYPGGYGVAVKLTGKNLHGNNNIHYWPEEALDAWKAKRASDDLDSDDEEESPNTVGAKRIGHLGIHTENDYISDPSIELTSVNFSVELGLYGPVLKRDRKRETDYDVKNYLFSDAPMEYGFAVPEKIAGEKQVIDITDDATGTRHEAALHLPMSYINEVGHNPDLKANVHLRDKNDRSVFYYLALTSALKKGESVELLADYDDTYEPVRERKGYGKANIENGVQSDDHEPTALARNFEERQFIVDKVNGLHTVQLFHLTEFIVENTLEPLDDLIETFLGSSSAHANAVRPTCLQWVARQRFTWLSELILQQISCITGEWPKELPPGYPHKSLLQQVKKWAKQMKWANFNRCMNSLAERDVDAFEALKVASRAEILYKLSKKIVKPLDENMWCPLSTKLIKSLCDDTSSSLSLKAGERERFLLESYLGRAKEATAMVRAACGDNKEELKFVSLVAKDEVLNESSLQSFKGFKEGNFFRKHSTVRKGILACMLEIQAYRDALELGFVQEQWDVKIVPQGTSHEVLVVKGSSPAAAETANVEGVIGYPRHANSAMKDGVVNEDWYLLWQVVFVVHCFAEEFIGNPLGGKVQFSLETLCDHIGVDFVRTQAVLYQGIDVADYEVNFVGKTRRQQKKRTPRKRAPCQAVQSYKGPSINKKMFEGVIWKALVGLGWTLDVGTRPTDYYYLPPGVSRCRGFSNRTDYFDSTKLVVGFITTDPRWKDRSEVVEALALFHKLEEHRGKKKLPKDFDGDQLIDQVNQS